MCECLDPSEEKVERKLLASKMPLADPPHPFPPFQREIEKGKPRTLFLLLWNNFPFYCSPPSVTLPLSLNREEGKREKEIFATKGESPASPSRCKCRFEDRVTQGVVFTRLRIWEETPTSEAGSKNKERGTFFSRKYTLWGKRQDNNPPELHSSSGLFVRMKGGKGVSN